MDMRRSAGIDLFGDEMKKWLRLTGAVVMPVLFLWQGPVTARAVREGLLLCAQAVIPALFPFMAAVRFAIGCGLGDGFSPGVAALLPGLVGGYPMGAAAVGQLREDGQLSPSQAAGLLCCCNQAGPAFILTFLGQGIFGSARTGLLLWGIHLLSAGIMAVLFFPRHIRPAARSARPFAPAPAFVEAVTEATRAMVRVCGFVVLFSVVTALLRHFGVTAPLLLGALELTCGAGALPRTGAGFVMAAALLGWGGVSVHCQTAAVLSGTGLPLGRYVAAKALQGGISAVLAALAVRWI